ncbi:MAG: phosphoribosylanthranilate isomerase [Bacteroidota bacterium]
MEIKVCGMKHPANVLAVLNLPVNYLGFIFYEKSARCVELAAHAFTGFEKIGSQGINKVGVFVDAPMETVVEKVRTYSLDYVQLHGKENVFYCNELKRQGIRIIKAFSVDDTFVFTNTDAYQYDCDFFLFDTKGKNPGGNGVQFDWSILEQYEGNTPFFLSGGIGPQDAAAIKALSFPRLHAIDVNSGFEIEPGLKNIDHLSEFVLDIRSQNRSSW